MLSPFCGLTFASLNIPFVTQMFLVLMWSSLSNFFPYLLVHKEEGSKKWVNVLLPEGRCPLDLTENHSACVPSDKHR